MIVKINKWNLIQRVNLQHQDSPIIVKFLETITEKSGYVEFDAQPAADEVLLLKLGSGACLEIKKPERGTLMDMLLSEGFQKVLRELKALDDMMLGRQEQAAPMSLSYQPSPDSPQLPAKRVTRNCVRCGESLPPGSHGKRIKHAWSCPPLSTNPPL
jgi:hypothetical protein